MIQTMDWQTNRAQIIAQHGLVLVGFVILTLLMVWPAPLRVNSEVIGNGGDPWQTMWRFESTAQSLKQAVSRGTIKIFLHDEFLGGGQDRLINLSVWPYLLLQLLLGQPLTYNIVWFLSFVLSGYAIYVLCLTLAKQSSPLVHAAAFVAGVYYMFLPYHVSHGQGHFGAMQTEWIPLIFLIAILFWRRSSWLKATVLGVLVVIQAWSEHHYLVWLVLTTLIVILFFWKEIKVRWLADKAFQRYGLLAALIIIVGVCIPYIPTLRLALQAQTPLVLGQEQTIRFSADIFSFITPAAFHPLWGNLFYTLFSKSFTGNQAESTQYLGVVFILFLLFFHNTVPTLQKKFWLLLAALFSIIALGPYLHIFGHVTKVPLLYILLEKLPIIDSIRTVGRSAVMVGLSSSMLLFWLIKENITRRSVFLALGVLVILDFLFFPVFSQSTAISSVYNDIKALPQASIIELPAATNYTFASQSLYTSLLHGKTILGSIALERGQDPDEFTPVKSAPGIRQLLYLRTTELRRDRSEFFSQALPETLPDTLRYFDVGAIVLHTDSLSVLQTSALRSFLEQDMKLSPRTYSDNVVAYFFDPNNMGQAHDGIFIMRDGAWTNVGFDPKKNSVFAEIPRTAALSIANVQNEAKKVNLEFTVPTESSSAVIVSSQDRPSVMVPVASKGVVPLLVSPGVTTITFTSAGNNVSIIQNPSYSVTP